MSTYGTAVIIDVPAEAQPAVADALRDHPIGAGSRTTLADGSTRYSIMFEMVELVDDVEAALREAGAGRAAIAEDNDEYGARWVVLAAEGDGVRVVHRRYLLNADPDDADEVAGAIEELGTDPRSEDVAGAAAATAVAELFSTDPALLVAAENDSASAWQQLGTVGGPFPWWDALALPWPVPVSGAPLDW